ncbi:MAG: tetratricopeptide repeat protein [bacterium]|nr:tetratricopeptide repeat protein [bacterium]
MTLLGDSKPGYLIVFALGTLITGGAVVLGLYESLSHDRRLPPPRLNEAVEAYLGEIEAMLERGDYDNAEQELRVSLRLLHPHEGHHLAHELLGRTLAAQGENDEAVRHFRESVTLAPNFSAAHYNLALTYEHMDRTDEAIAEYRRVLSIDPAFAPARNNLQRLEQLSLTRAPQTDGSPLGLGRSYAALFYRGDLDALYARFSPRFASQLDRTQLTALHASIEQQLGFETELLDESSERGKSSTLYVRRANFERFDGEAECVIELNDDGSINGLLFRPAGSR